MHKSKVDNATIAYYAMNEPLMTDEEYDKLFAEVYGDSTSPYELYKSLFVNDGRKRKLGKPMLSLSKAKKPDVVAKWVDKIDGAEVVLSPKYDGAACLIEVRGGEIVSAVTRGNGSMGDDVTYAVQNIAKGDVPTTDGLHQVEICMSVESMDEINKTRDEDNQYKHPRNATAGVLRLANSSVKEYAPYLSIHKHFDANAFGVTRVVDHDEDVSAVMDSYRSDIINAMDSTGSTIMLDGVVLFARDSNGEPMTSMGNDGAHPYWAIAWKFPDKGQVANIKNIHWQQGRVKNTPVATFSPPLWFGATISRATLHNSDQIKRMGIKIGDQVELIRSGEVIPYVVKKVRDGDNRVDVPPEPTGDAPLTMNVRHFMKTLDVRGAGPSVADDLARKIDEHMEPGDSRPVSILRVLTEMLAEGPAAFKDAVSSFGDNRAESFSAELSSKMESADMVHWLAAMGLPGIGRRMFSKILADIDGAKNLVAFLDSDDNKPIDGFGAERIGILKENRDDIADFIQLVIDSTSAVPNWYDSAPSATNAGGAAVVTGKIDGVSRNDIARVLEENGWELGSSVSNSTNILFNAGGKESTKTRSAAKKGVTVISVSSVDDIVDAISGE